MRQIEPSLARMWLALGGEEPELEMVAPGGYPAHRSNLDVPALA